GDRRERLLAFADARLTNTMARDTRVFSQSLAAFGVSGRTGDDDWTRGTVAARLHAGVRSLAIGVEGVAGLASSGSPMWEQFTVGGSAVPFADAALMSQRVALGGLPAGALVGDRLLLWRVDAQLGL